MSQAQNNPLVSSTDLAKNQPNAIPVITPRNPPGADQYWVHPYTRPQTIGIFRSETTPYKETIIPKRIKISSVKELMNEKTMAMGRI